MVPYVLHYAPDNASLIIRLVLEELGVPYETTLVDRQANAQRGEAYKALNPVGRIPALETPNGPIFETAAIALWLADTHRDTVQLSPSIDAPERARFLSWLFFLSNTVHAELRSLFYPGTIVGKDPSAQAALQARTRKNLARHYDVLNTECERGGILGGGAVNLCDLYTAAVLRWPAIYPAASDRSWFTLASWPALERLARTVEARPSTSVLVTAEGMNPTPFTNPAPPNPPEGSAI